MLNTFANLLRRPGMRYVIIGGSVYLFELLVIVVMQALGAGQVLAVAISFCMGTAVSFLLQKIVTFKDKRMHHKVIIPQIAATVALIIFNLGFTLLLTKIFENNMPAIVTRTIALGITTIWNFYLYKTRIFKTTTQLVE